MTADRGEQLTGDPGPIGNVSLGAACAVFDESGRVLLVRHTYGRFNWELPGGIVQPGEDPRAGALRELEEETGLRGDQGSLSGVYFELEHWSGSMLHLVFRVTVPTGSEPSARPPEIGDVGWFPIESLPRPISDFTERRIHDAHQASAGYAVVVSRTWRE